MAFITLKCVLFIKKIHNILNDELDIRYVEYQVVMEEMKFDI